MQVVIAMAALIGLALLSAGAARRAMNNRILGMAISGLWGAAVIGVIFRTDAVGLVDLHTRELATPLVMATLGWVGIMIGLQFRREVLARVPFIVWRMVAVDAIVTLLFWCPIAVGLVWWCFEGQRADILIGAAARLGAMMIGWSSETRSLRPRGATDATPGENALRASGAISSFVAICIYGIAVFGVIGTRRHILEPENLGAGLAGAALGLALAIIGGAMLGRFGFALAGRSRGDQLVVFLGVLTLVAGIAAKMGVAALLCSAAVGVIIGNSRGFGAREFERFLLRAEIATASLLGLLVGISATVHIGKGELVIAGAIVAWRIVVKPLVVKLCVGRTAPDPSLIFGPIRPHPIALAIALGLMIRSQDVIATRVCMVILIGSIASDLAAWAIARWMEHRADARTPLVQGATS